MLTPFKEPIGVVDNSNESRVGILKSLLKSPPKGHRQSGWNLCNPSALTTKPRKIPLKVLNLRLSFSKRASP